MNIWTKEDHQKLVEAEKAVDELTQRMRAYSKAVGDVLEKHHIYAEDGNQNLDIASLRKALEPFDPSVAAASAAATGPVVQDGEFIQWSGGKCPVDGQTVVGYRMRNGRYHAGMARMLRWDHRVIDSDIVCYCVLGEGWIRWDGGARPVVSESEIEFLRRDGFCRTDAKARELRWEHLYAHDDIIAYKVVEQKTVDT